MSWIQKAVIVISTAVIAGAIAYVVRKK